MPARFGELEVLRRIAVGGMGEVFRARRVDSPEELALKLIRPEHAREASFRRMFLREARIASRIRHPNIVGVFDFGEIDGTPYMTMELVDGVPVARIVEAAGPLSPGTAAYVIVSVLDALHHVHELTGQGGAPLGLVHRDVSAGNVLCSMQGEIKLTDFGLAKLTAAASGTTTDVKGTRGYMSPEQLAPSRARPIDRRADVFSAGVLLHCLSTGRQPFADTIDWLRSGAPPIATGPFAPAIARAVSLHPSERFATARELADAVRACVAPSPAAHDEIRAAVASALEEAADPPSVDELILANLGLHLPAGREATRKVHSPGADIRSPSQSDVLTRPIGPGPGHRSLDARSSRGRGTGRIIAAAAIAAAAAGALAWSLASGTAATERPPDQVEASPPPQPAIAPPPLRAAVAPEASAAPADADAGAAPPHRPERRRRGARLAAEPGLLTLDSEPWAIVYLGGRRLGTTPFTRVRLPAGRHRLVLDLEGKGRRRSVSVVIRPGSETRRSVAPR